MRHKNANRLVFFSTPFNVNVRTLESLNERQTNDPTGKNLIKKYQHYQFYANQNIFVLNLNVIEMQTVLMSTLT